MGIFSRFKKNTETANKPKVDQVTTKSMSSENSKESFLNKITDDIFKFFTPILATKGIEKDVLNSALSSALAAGIGKSRFIKRKNVVQAMPIALCLMRKSDLELKHTGNRTGIFTGYDKLEALEQWLINDCSAQKIIRDDIKAKGPNSDILRISINNINYDFLIFTHARTIDILYFDLPEDIILVTCEGGTLMRGISGEVNRSNGLEEAPEF